MRVLIIALAILLLISCNEANCMPLSGVVQKENYLQQTKANKIVDNASGKPISNALVSIPAKGVSTITDPNGTFSLDANVNNPIIMSVKADGYKPFSLTVNQDTFRKPLTIGITKQSLNEIVIDSSLHHLGDNNFSYNSANADDFRSHASGSRITKRFFVKTFKPNESVQLKIGSIIGIDTEMAQRLNQNNISFAFSSPTRIYLNSGQIGEIKINGDEQAVSFSSSLLKPNAYNEVTIETGRNLSQHDYVDFDDMEFMNLILEFR